jgi:hypothetical protein
MYELFACLFILMTIVWVFVVLLAMYGIPN